MKKLFNFRPIFLVFCGVFIGAFFSIDILRSNVWVKVLVISLTMLMFILAFMPISFFKLRRLMLILFSLSLCVGFLFSFIRIEIYNSTKINQTVSISGVVTDKISQAKSGYVTLVLRDAKCKEVKLNGNIEIYVTNAAEDNFKAGDKLEFVGYVQTRELINTNGVANAKYDAMGCKYYCYISYNDLAITSGRATIFEKIRISGRQSIIKACGSCDEADMLYSVLFGDKTYLSYSFTNMFSLSGTAHLLAVSGLHIGFIVAIIVFICKKCRAKPWVTFSIVGFMLTAYMFICGFSVSVVRASIMSLVLLGAAVVGKRYDGLTSLGLAGLIILLIKPLYALDLGFQLSFGSVLGIMCFNEAFCKGLRACKFPHKVADAMALTLSSYVGTLPFTLSAFGKLSWIGILSNIILVPLFGIIFSIAFVVMLICLAMPFAYFLYVPIRWFTFAFIKIVQFFALFKPFIVLGFGAFTIIYLAVMLCISRFSFVSKVLKICGGVALSLVFCASAIVPLIPSQFEVAGVYSAGSSGYIVAASKKEAVYVTSSFAKSEADEVFDNLNANRLSGRVKNVVITSTPSLYTKRFALDNPHINIYYFLGDMQEFASISNIKRVDISASLNGGIEISPVVINGRVVLASLSVNGYDIAFVNNLTAKEVKEVNKLNLIYNLWVFDEFETILSTQSSSVISKVNNGNENIIISPDEFNLAMEIGGV